MKKIVILSILLSSSYVFSQSDDKNESKVKTKFYIGLGGHNQKFTLNDKLNFSNVAKLNETAFDLAFGINVFGKKYSGDLEFSTAVSRNDNENSKNVYANFSTRVRFHYNVINKNEMAFTAGLNLAYAVTDATFYSKNNSIDLNNLQPNNNFGEFSLINNVFYAGPSVALYVRKHKKTSLRLNIGYEFALSNGRWKSDFATVNNTVNESGNNRFIFGISLL
jgi:hypothetical protein